MKRQQHLHLLLLHNLPHHNTLKNLHMHRCLNQNPSLSRNQSRPLPNSPQTKAWSRVRCTTTKRQNRTRSRSTRKT